MKRVYECNICRTTIKPVNLYGVYFLDLKKFTLGCYGSTEGTHICLNCASQLRDHLNSEAISEDIETWNCKENK